jgi:hypothetical protein
LEPKTRLVAPTCLGEVARRRKHSKGGTLGHE